MVESAIGQSIGGKTVTAVVSSTNPVTGVETKTYYAGSEKVGQTSPQGGTTFAPPTEGKTIAGIYGTPQEATVKVATPSGVQVQSAAPQTVTYAREVPASIQPKAYSPPTLMASTGRFDEATGKKIPGTETIPQTVTVGQNIFLAKEFFQPVAAPVIQPPLAPGYVRATPAVSAPTQGRLISGEQLSRERNELFTFPRGELDIGKALSDTGKVFLNPMPFLTTASEKNVFIVAPKLTQIGVEPVGLYVKPANIELAAGGSAAITGIIVAGAPLLPVVGPLVAESLLPAAGAAGLTFGTVSLLAEPTAPKFEGLVGGTIGAIAAGSAISAIKSEQLSLKLSESLTKEKYYGGTAVLPAEPISSQAKINGEPIMGGSTKQVFAASSDKNLVESFLFHKTLGISSIEEPEIIHVREIPFLTPKAILETGTTSQAVTQAAYLPGVTISSRQTYDVLAPGTRPIGQKSVIVEGGKQFISFPRTSSVQTAVFPESIGFPEGEIPSVTAGTLRGGKSVMSAGTFRPALPETTEADFVVTTQKMGFVQGLSKGIPYSGYVKIEAPEIKDISGSIGVSGKGTAFEFGRAPIVKETSIVPYRATATLTSQKQIQTGGTPLSYDRRLYDAFGSTAGTLVGPSKTISAAVPLGETKPTGFLLSLPSRGTFGVVSEGKAIGIETGKFVGVSPISRQATPFASTTGVFPTRTPTISIGSLPDTGTKQPIFPITKPSTITGSATQPITSQITDISSPTPAGGAFFPGGEPIAPLPKPPTIGGAGGIFPGFLETNKVFNPTPGKKKKSFFTPTILGLTFPKAFKQQPKGAAFTGYEIRPPGATSEGKRRKFGVGRLV